MLNSPLLVCINVRLTPDSSSTAVSAGSMLSDADLEKLRGDLGSFSITGLQNLLQNYEQVLEQYHQLKSDFEEERETREKYKKRARNQERNPFVLVLIDGDGYIFQEQLIRAGSDGGVTAAQRLNDAIKSCLGSDAGHYRVMVRIYANYVGLSKALNKAGITGPEKRSISTFTASFTRSQELFDFVDAGDKKEGADYKIREMFRLFVDNSQCRHIFFAGCHDTGYLSLLTPYQGKADKISLIRGAYFSPEFDSLGLKSIDLPSVFRSYPLDHPLDGMAGAKRASSPTKLSALSGSTKQPAPYKAVCRFYQMGTCKFGNNCKLEHVHAGSVSPVTAHRTPHQSHPNGSDLWRNGGNVDKGNISTRLPKSSLAGLIPINKDHHRIDYFMESPSTKDFALYTASTKAMGRKPCNKLQLTGRCDTLDCTYNHDSLPPAAVGVIKYMLRSSPCKFKGRCRIKECPLGHMCTKDECFGPNKFCRLNRAMHFLDTEVADWVQPSNDSIYAAHSTNNDSQDNLGEDMDQTSSTKDDLDSAMVVSDFMRNESKSVGVDVNPTKDESNSARHGTRSAHTQEDFTDDSDDSASAGASGAIIHGLPMFARPL